MREAASREGLVGILGGSEARGAQCVMRCD